MMRVLSVGERNVFAGGGAPVNVPAATTTEVIPDQTTEPRNIEIANRYIQNVGANALYYAFGQQASPNNYHGVLQQWQQLDCSSHRLSVSVYSTAGTTVAQCIIFRNDLGRNNTVLPTK